MGFEGYSFMECTPQDQPVKLQLTGLNFDLNF